MRLWSRPSRRQMLCLWLLLLALAWAAFGLTDLVFRDEMIQKTPRGSQARRPFQQPLPPGGSSDLEVIVDSRDRAARPERGTGLSPLNSLQEDQLLFVLSTQGKDPAPPPRRGSYRVVISGAKKNLTAPVIMATLGDAGESVKRKLGSLERDVELSALQKYGFNEMASERISLRRKLPEARHPRCLAESYSETLPSTSVVICFHDEAWSTLLRTVHSVLDTVPRKHLREVLLVDDFSQHGHLKSVLSEYLSHLEGVRLVRSLRRLGVGGCRSLGAGRAAGEVVVFMDAHCECSAGWLEPLLERVAQDRTRVVSPVMDVIDWQTLQYSATQWPVRGVFDWRLDFHWEFGQKPEGQPKPTKESPIQPVRSPALGGGVLVIDRHFFQSVGGYDPGMVLWGAEQVELSIRVWSCGGSMEVVPCSRVAHLRRRPPPYPPLPDADVLQRNKVRVADTWLDAFKKIYYKRDTLAHFIRQSESPNITERVRLKKSLGCRNFYWFLTNVYPELYIPQDRPALSGELYNVGTGYCADYPRGLSPEGGAMNLARCSGTGKQHCELNSRGQVRWGPAGALCFDALRERVVLIPCPAPQPSHSKPQWMILKLSGQLVHLPSQLCLEAVKGGGAPQRDVRGHLTAVIATETGLFLLPCTHSPRQQWHFEQLVVPKGA